MSLPIDPQSPADRQRWYWLLAIAGLLLVLYWQTAVSVHLRWIKLDQSYSHGYLLFGLGLYFAWLQRYRLAAKPLPFSPIYAVPLLLVSLAWGVAQLLSVQVVAQLMLPLAFLAAIATAFGYAFARCLFVPVALLYVGIPIWEDFLNTPLRVMTVNAVGSVLQMVSFPASITGFRIEIPYGAFMVAGGCSGLGFFLTGLTIALSYAYLNLSSTVKRVAFVVFCIVVSVVSNWVRVGALVVIGYVSRMQNALITGGHLMFGWYLFAGAMVIMLLVGHQIAKRDEPNDFGDASDYRSTAKPSRAGLALAIAGLAIGPALTYAYFAAPTANVALRFAAPVVSTPSEAAHWQPDFRGWSAAAHGTLPVQGASDIDINVFYYARQSQNRKLISFENRIADPKTSHIEEESKVPATTAGGVPVNEAIISNAVGARRVVWYWFDIGGATATSGSRTIVLALERLLTHGRTDGALVAVSMTCPFDCESERVALKGSIGELRTQAAEVLKQTR